MSAPIGGDLPYVILELGDQAGVPGVAELYQNLKRGKGHLMDIHHRILRQRENLIHGKKILRVNEFAHLKLKNSKYCVFHLTSSFTFP
jgi:hypothetical protein